MATTGILGFTQTPEDEKKKKQLITGMASPTIGTMTPEQVPNDYVSGLPGLNIKNAVGGPTQVNPANLPQGFQFTGTWADRDRALRQQESDAGLRRRDAIGVLDEDYNAALRKTKTVQELARERLNDKLASQGIAHSGINLKEQGNLDTQFQDYLNDLSTQRARGISGIESDYSSILNNLARTREGFFGEQQKEEEQRKLEEAKVQAETERLAREQAERQAMLDQILAQQEAARIANEQALAAIRLQPPTVIYPGGGGGGGGDYYEEPQAPPAAPDKGPMVTLPFLSGGQRATQGNVDNWIRQNVDPWVTGTALAKVREVLMKSPQGVPLNDLAWLIKQYPNTPSPGVNMPW